MEIVGFCGSVGGDEVSVNEVSQAPMGRRQLVTVQNTVLHNIYSISWSKTSKYCCFLATKEKAAAFLRQRLHVDLQISVLERNIVVNRSTCGGRLRFLFLGRKDHVVHTDIQVMIRLAILLSA